MFLKTTFCLTSEKLIILAIGLERMSIVYLIKLVGNGLGLHDLFDEEMNSVCASSLDIGDKDRS